MEKLYTCVGCSKSFKVLSSPDNSVYAQHEVEMGVECPYCSKTNAIVWPQDEESLPLVVTMEKPRVNSNVGNFYVQDQCCTSCGVPQAVAPDLVGWTDENPSQCYWMKQPQTPDELDRAVKIIHSQELGCHRYSGDDPVILRRLPAENCDHFRPDLKLKFPYVVSSGPPPKFKLSASEKNGLLSKLWRVCRRKGTSEF
jgi:DNA-directed RNA polymerase subunit RPC12/RpoP